MSTLTILLAYATFASFLDRPLAAFAALLTALSPHLVMTNVYVLTETLSCFLLMLCLCLCLWLLSLWHTKPSPWLFSVGLMLAFASLTRPWTQFFILRRGRLAPPGSRATTQRLENTRIASLSATYQAQHVVGGGANRPPLFIFLLIPFVLVYLPGRRG